MNMGKYLSVLSLVLLSSVAIIIGFSGCAAKQKKEMHTDAIRIDKYEFNVPDGYEKIFSKKVPNDVQDLLEISKEEFPNGFYSNKSGTTILLGYYPEIVDTWIPTFELRIRMLDSQNKYNLFRAYIPKDKEYITGDFSEIKKTDDYLFGQGVLYIAFMKVGFNFYLKRVMQDDSNEGRLVAISLFRRSESDLAGADVIRIIDSAIEVPLSRNEILKSP